MPEVSPVVAVMKSVGISEQQIADLLKVLIPAARGLDSFENIFTRFAERAAGNGFTSDMAGAAAFALTAFDPIPGPYAELVQEISDHFHAGPISKTEAASFARRAYGALAAQLLPDAPSETAVVPANGPNGKNGQVVEGTASVVPPSAAGESQPVTPPPGEPPAGV